MGKQGSEESHPEDEGRLSLFIFQKLDHISSRIKLTICVVSTLFCLILAVPLYARAGMNAGIMAVFPMVLISVFFGYRTAWVGSLIVTGLHFVVMFFEWLAGTRTGVGFAETFGLLALIVVSVIIGLFRDVSKQLEQEIERRVEAEQVIEEMNQNLKQRIMERTSDLLATNQALEQEIGNRKLAEEALRQLNAELEQRVSDRTAALESANTELESFAYSVSHDLRAPLRAMDGFSRILVKEHISELSDQARGYLERVSSSSQRMGDLIDGLLDFSRLSRQPLSKRTVDPADVLQQALEEIPNERSEQDCEIIIHPLPRCQADPGLLKRVFANLVGNAMKFTREREPAIIEIGSDQGNGRPIYYVRDNGVGFDMQYADKVFGVFQRLHRAEDYEGTGVGLANVQRIIHRHGGRVWVEAEVDKGATFFFTLDGEVSDAG